MIDRSGTNDIGRYLSSVAERDIDLLLMEEFHVSDEFVRWFAAQVGEEGAVPTGAWHSLSDTDGETDLLLRVRCGRERVGILIENKVNAPEQDGQAERYHLRGIRSREAGKFDRFLTVMCAPSRYLSTIAPDSPYQFRISYESIAEWFANGSDKRSQWRHEIMLEAIEQGRRGYTMAVNETTSRFHREFHQFLKQRYPRLQMREPGNKGGNSNWIVIKGVGFPKDVTLNYKLGKRTIDLSFFRMDIETLIERGPWPDDIFVQQLGMSAALVMDTPEVDIAKSVFEQSDVIEDVLAKAVRLAAYAKVVVGQ